MITKIWYSISNNGDGSASVIPMESEELCELHQRLLMDEGWAEDCHSYIAIESENPIIIKEAVTTIDDCIEEIKEELKWCERDEEEKKLLNRKLEALNKLKEKQ